MLESCRVGQGLVVLLFMLASPRRVAREFLDFFEPSVLATAIFERLL